MRPTASLKLDPEALLSVLHPAGQPRVPPPADAAAVLLLIAATPEPHTFLTLRSAELPMHPGQISLPGGRVATPDPSLEATALREAQEETGLDPAAVRLLGRLPPVTVALSGIEITPVVAWADAAPTLRADPREVASIISCPLQLLLQQELWRREALERNGQRREFWVIDLDGHRVWGATAAILKSLVNVLEAVR